MSTHSHSPSERNDHPAPAAPRPLPSPTAAGHDDCARDPTGPSRTAPPASMCAGARIAAPIPRPAWGSRSTTRRRKGVGGRIPKPPTTMYQDQYSCLLFCFVFFSCLDPAARPARAYPPILYLKTWPACLPACCFLAPLFMFCDGRVRFRVVVEHCVRACVRAFPGDLIHGLGA